MQSWLRKKTWGFLATSLLAAVGLVGCGSDSDGGGTGGTGGASCQGVANACETAGAHRCAGNAVETCQPDSNSCLVWVQGAACSARATCSEGACVCNTQECDFAGGSSCDGNTLKTCKADESQCRYLEATDCSTDGKACVTVGTQSSCGSACTNDCPSESATRCEGNVIQTCAAGTNGCLGWTAGTDCATSNQVCDATSGTAQCVAACTNNCPTAGNTQCSGNVIQTCTADANGCLDWAAGTDCATSNQVCDASSGTAQCANSCVSDCTQGGQTQCSGLLVQTCVHGANGCYNWQTTTDCATTSQVCDASGGTAHCSDTCQDTCTQSGSTQCSGNVIQTCSLGANGCLGWTAGTNCATTGQACSATGGTAHCVNTCTNQCPTAGNTQCSGTTIQTCSMGTNGCLGWTSGTNCAATSQVCDATGGTAHCANTCTDQCAAPGNTQCSGTTIQNCIVGTSGCLEWTNGTNCGATSQVCDITGGTAHCAAACTDSCSTEGAGQCTGNSSEVCTRGTNGCLSLVTTDCGTQGCLTSGTSAQCNGNGDTCGSVHVITSLPYNIHGTNITTDFANDLSLGGHTGCGTANGVDAVMQITLNAGESIRLVETGALDAVIRVTSECSAAATCVLSSDTPEDVTFTATTAGTYFIVLEAYSATPSSRDYNFTVDRVIARKGMYESFGSTDLNDLEGCTVAFTPSGTDPSGYTQTTTCPCAPALPNTPGSGTATSTVTLTDTSSAVYNLSVMPNITFYGKTYTSFYVGSNGFITFGTGDSNHDTSSADFFALPRLAGLDMDLDPSTGGSSVVVDEWADHVAVTYNNVDVYVSGSGTRPKVTFQLVINSAGDVSIAYGTIGEKAKGWVGIANGGSAGTAPTESNFITRAITPSAAGDLFFTELMWNPHTVDDAAGEYIELYNPTTRDFSLECCQITDSNGSHAFVPANTSTHAAYTVLVRNADAAANGGIANGIALGTDIQLRNSTAEVLTLTCRGTVIDTVPLNTASPWPAGGDGISMQLSTLGYNATTNDVAAYWCDSTSHYPDPAATTGDFGTPGTVNTDCAPTPFVEESFETNPNWTVTGDWQWGTPNYASGPSACGDGTSCYGTNMTGDYGNSRTFANNYLQMGPIDLSASPAGEPVLLMFDMWLNSESGYDFTQVQYSTDGTVFSPVLNVTPAYNGAGPSHLNQWTGASVTSGNWVRVTADISGQVGQATVFLRWALSSDGSDAFAGMYIDHVRLARF